MAAVGGDASTYCYGEGIHADYPAPPVSLEVTDEHKVCDGVRSHLSAEEMSKQIHPWRRPRVLITRSIFCNRGQRVKLIYCVRMHMEEENLKDLTDSMSRIRWCACFFFFLFSFFFFPHPAFEQLCALVCVFVEVVAGLLFFSPLRLPSARCGLAGATLPLTAPEPGECCRQSSGMTNPSGARLGLNGAQIQKNYQNPERPDLLHHSQTTLCVQCRSVSTM